MALKLREVAESIRHKPTPLTDLIPLLQRATDMLEVRDVEAPPPPCRETIRAMLALFSFEGCDFCFNEPNNYGYITGTLWIGKGDANMFRGEERTAEFAGGVVRGTGYYKINELGVRRIEELILRAKSA